MKRVDIRVNKSGSALPLNVRHGKIDTGCVVDRVIQKAEAQSWENVKDSIGGNKSKPFMMVAMPEGTSDGIYLIRLSELEKVIDAIQDNWDRFDEEK